MDTWEADSWEYTGHAGVWTQLTVDDELGYLYLPTESATNDWYGGHRLGNNLFAESLVCLDIRTGERVWHYQLIHHGIWDYDNPSPPTLLDVTHDGQRIRAVAVVTKQGHTYVFDRESGEPLWPIIEMPVPASDVPGEQTSPTQPIPSKPAPFERNHRATVGRDRERLWAPGVRGGDLNTILSRVFLNGSHRQGRR